MRRRPVYHDLALYEACMIRYTINSSVQKPWELYSAESEDMAALADQIFASFDINEDKRASDLLIPVAEWSERYREKSNIVLMSSLFVADVDRIDTDRANELFDAIEGTSAILYTTHSHMTPRKGGLGCYRVILELDREYLPTEYPIVRAAVNDLLGGVIDPGTDDHQELGYYLPSAPASCSDFAARVYAPGDRLCLDQLLDMGRTLGAVESLPAMRKVHKPREGTAPSAKALRDAVAKWARSGYSFVQNSAAMARAILDGKPSIPVGESRRNESLYQLAGQVAYTWRDADGDAIAALFDGVGWDLLSPDGKYTIDDFAKMIARQQDNKDTWDREQQRELLASVTAGERTELITPEEIRGLQERFGEAWHRHVIAVLNKDLYFLRPDGSYDPAAVMKENLFVASRDRLAVFGDEVQDTYDATDGPKRKTPQQFLEEYATLVDRAVFDLCHPEGGWDPIAREILLPLRRHVEPKESPEIQQWLESCSPDLILCDMLSQVPHHSRALPALLMIGGKDTGKTLLAKGVSRIYAAGPTDADAAFDQYNASSLLACPVVFMDERASKQYKQEGTTFIRRYMSQDVRRLDEKYRARVELRGYVRLLIAGNSLDIMTTSEDMGAADRAAFTERIVYVDMDNGAEVLAQHPASKIQREWLDERRFASHVLWLSENWRVRNPGKRFAVQQRDATFQASITSCTGTTQEVLYWLLMFVDTPVPVLQANAAIAVKGGDLRVSSTAVFRHWDEYLKGRQKPSPALIGRAISSLAVGSRQKIWNTARNAYEIDMDQLAAANEKFGIVSDLPAALAQAEAECRKKGIM